MTASVKLTSRYEPPGSLSMRPHCGVRMDFRHADDPRQQPLAAIEKTGAELANNRPKPSAPSPAQEKKSRSQRFSQLREII